MYESFYALSRKPFDNVPDPEFYFETVRTREALECLRFSALAEGGISILTGGVGCGKTLLLRMLMKEMASRCEMAYLASALDSPEELLAELVYQLGGDGAGGTRPELSRRIGEMLFHAMDSGKKSLLVFDHVTGMVGEEVAREIARIADLQLDDRSLASILIAEEGTIEARLSSSTFGKRISVITHVGPLSLADSIGYMEHRLRVAGGAPDLFTREAKAAIAAAAGGVPGRINSLADLCLYMGSRASARHVDIRLVDLALSRSVRREVQGTPQEM